MPGLTLNITFGGELHTRIMTAVSDRIKASKRELDKNGKWKQAEDKVLAYLPEREVDAVRRLKREDGKPHYTTIQVPYSYAVLSSAHTYWTSVFLSRTPIMQFTGRHGESQMQVQAMEALMDYQMQVGEMLVPLYIWIHDVGKYGLGVLGTHWAQEESVVSEIVEEEELFLGMVPTGKTKKVQRTRRIRGYTGNRIYNIRPQDFLPDPRVPVHLFQKGEYCAVYTEIGWNEVLRRKAAGAYTNIEKLIGRQPKHTGEIGSEGERTESSEQLGLPSASSFSPHEKDTSGTVKAYECHIELVPNDWNLGNGKFPEKWVFTITSDLTTVIGAQPLGAVHNKFPFNVMELEPEGYALINRGIPEILEPIQNTMDWLLNSHFYNVRKALNDQFIVDPSRVVMSDVTDPLPGGIIRLKPVAYGTDTRTVMTQLGVVDITQGHMRDLDVMMKLGERVSGVSDQIQGVIEKSGRRTATEARQTGAFSINRLKTTSELFSAMGWAPMSQMFVQNSQQYYDVELKMRIVGDLAREAGQQFMDVKPDDIQGFYNFVPVDGSLPIDRFAQANLWRELMGQMRNFPELMQTYDMSRIFAWVASLTGLKNIEQFKIQVLPDQELAQQSQAGNVVPLPPGGGGQADLGRNVGLKQTSQVGPAG